jgi:hypothetical protein
MAKVPTTAFVLDNGVFAIIHVNVARCLLGNNSPSLVFNYVASLIHELSHIKNFGKSEKEIQELETSILEEFLGWKLPEEYKNRETSDYYF